VAGRIDRFLDPSSGDTYQVDMAIASFVRGGWFGAGPGEGSVKRFLPDAHTDFVFAVTAEEFGILACGALVLLIAFIVLRGLLHAARERDVFARLAIAGLVVLFGVQATINMGVNLHLMPAKGMTLPFVSYGGSSLLAVGLGMGFVLALARRRPRPIRFTPVEPEELMADRRPRSVAGAGA
jgi:cell division protein FtsW